MTIKIESLTTLACVFIILNFREIQETESDLYFFNISCTCKFNTKKGAFVIKNFINFVLHEEINILICGKNFA